MNADPRLITLHARICRIVEFGPLGSKVNWKKPLIIAHPAIPMGAAAYKTPVAVRFGKGTSAQARAGGAVLTSEAKVPEILAKVSGYPDSGSMGKALVRHELVHSVQAAKRGYKSPSRIRDLLKDEIGAYSNMNRGVQGGSKLIRGVNGVSGVAVSTALGTALNPRLRKRAAMYAGGAALAVGGGLAVRAALNRPKDDEN